MSLFFHKSHYPTKISIIQSFRTFKRIFIQNSFAKTNWECWFCVCKTRYSVTFISRPPPPLHTPQLPRKGKPPPLFLRRRGELFPFPRAARVRGKMGGVRARGSPTIFLYNKKEKVGDLYRSWMKAGVITHKPALGPVENLDPKVLLFWIWILYIT
jgi:hypothetical protein